MAPRRRVLPLLLLAASLLPAATGAKEFRGKRLPLAEPPHSQLAERHPVHALGTEIRIGKAVFAAAEEKGKLLVAATPGAAPSVAVAAGKPVPFAWTGDDGDRSVRLTFGRDADDAWTWWASEAVRFAVDGEEFRIYDADGDGRYGDLAKDGWSTGGTDMVLPLTKEIPLGPNLLALESVDPDGGRILGAVTPVAGTKAQLAALLLVNRLRTAHALPPVILDETLSAGCSAHAAYLAANHWSGRTNPHEQNLGPKGASPEGALAAARSAIGTPPPAVSVAGFWRTYYHRIGLSGPALDRIGVNAEPPEPAVVDVARGYGEGPALPGVGAVREKGDGSWPWADPVFVPADGSVGFPTRAEGELPSEPVPDLGSRGAPIMAVFRATTEVEGFAGILEEVRGRAAAKVPVLAADPGMYVFAPGIVPEKPLRGKTDYRATFTWKSGGKEFRRVVRFRTE